MTLCNNHACPSCRKCWRYTKPREPGEPTTTFVPGRSKFCKWFYPFLTTTGYTAQKARHDFGPME